MTAPRLAVLLLALAAPLAACGDTPAGQALRGVAPGTVAPAPVPVEGPALLLLTPRRATLLPVGEGGTRRLWRGEANLALATEGARVVATAGLAQMLMSTRFEGADPLEDPRALLGRQAVARRTVDLSGADRDPRGMRFGLRLDCTLRGQAEGGWIVVDERCVGERVAFTNRFWAVPETGAVMQSTQWVGEGIGMLTIRMQGI